MNITYSEFVSFSLTRTALTTLKLLDIYNIIMNVLVVLHVKHPLFFSDVHEIWIVVTNFRRNIQISNFMKIRPVEDELSHGDGRTDMTQRH